MISTDTLSEKDPKSPNSFGTRATVEIEVLLSGVTFGPFSADKVRERIAEDLLALSDQARFTDSEEWSTLEDLLDRVPPEPPAAEISEPEAEPEAESASENGHDSSEPVTSAESAEDAESPAPGNPTITTALGRPTYDDPPEPDTTPEPVPEPASTPTDSVAKWTKALPLPAAFSPPPPADASIGERRSLAAKIGTGRLLGAVGGISSMARSSTSAMPILRPNAAKASPPPPKPVGGLRSQILARTSNEPLPRIGPARSEAPSVIAQPSLAGSASKSLFDTAASTAVSSRAPASAPGNTSPLPPAPPVNLSRTTTAALPKMETKPPPATTASAPAIPASTPVAPAPRIAAPTPTRPFRPAPVITPRAFTAPITAGPIAPLAPAPGTAPRPPIAPLPPTPFSRPPVVEKHQPAEPSIPEKKLEEPVALPKIEESAAAPGEVKANAVAPKIAPAVEVKADAVAPKIAPAVEAKAETVTPEIAPPAVPLPPPGAALLKPNPASTSPAFRLPTRVPTARIDLEDTTENAASSLSGVPSSVPSKALSRPAPAAPSAPEPSAVPAEPPAVAEPARVPSPNVSAPATESKAPESAESSAEAVAIAAAALIPANTEAPPVVPVAESSSPPPSPPVEPALTAAPTATSPPPATPAAVVPLASGTLPLPPAKPAEKRPAASIDSILTVRLPARRTQMIKTMPGAAVVKGPETKSEVQPQLVVPTEAPTRAFTAPLPAPIRANRKETDAAIVAKPEVAVASSDKSSDVPAASGLEMTAALPRTTPKPAANPVRRGMANASALAATTILNAAEKKASLPLAAKEGATPVATASIVPPAEKTSPPAEVPAASTPLKESARLASATPLVETRRAALKQAREARRRQGITFAVIGGIFFIVICAGIYDYLFSNREVDKPMPPPPTSEPAKAPAPIPLKTTEVSAPPEGPAPFVIQADSMSSAGDDIAPAPASTPSPVHAIAPPSNPQVPPLVAKGLAAQGQADLKGAMTIFSQVISLDPKYAQGYGYRAAVEEAKGDYPAATVDLNQLLTLDPTNANGFCQRGFLKQAAKDSDAAIADYSRAIQLDSRSFIAFYNRGMILEQKGRPDAAIADYDRAIEIDPHLAGAFFNRGNAKADKNDLDGAIADYTTSLEINPKIALAYCNRALAEQNSGSFLSALSDDSQALALNPNIAAAYYNRGLIEEQMNNLDACIEDSTKTIVLAPDNAQAYYNRGVALQAKGNLDAAANDLRKFNELAPKNVYADYSRLYLWVITNQQDRKTEADQELSSSLESNWNAEPAQLASKIAGFLLDKVPETDLLALASSPDTHKDQTQHCEVWYFDGMKKMLTGHKSEAIDCFHQCLNTGQKDFCEYILAEAELHTLSPG